MTYRVIIQPGAEREIKAQAEWIIEQSRSSSRALRWVRGVRANIATLKTKPQRCPVDPDSEAYGEEVRLMLFGKRQRRYRVLFAIRGGCCTCLDGASRCPEKPARGTGRRRRR
jgi:plasmid stabilization system protein ParE